MHNKIKYIEEFYHKINIKDNDGLQIFNFIEEADLINHYFIVPLFNIISYDKQIYI